MMRIAYFNAASGVSGDMFVGALIDAGACLNTLRSHIAALDLDGVEIGVRRVSRKGISAVKFDVLEPGTGRMVDAPKEQNYAGDSPSHHHHRGLQEIRCIIDDSSLPMEVKKSSIGVFELIAQAEAKVHGTSIEQVHFHEVGALDCIVDIVAAASAFHQLGIDEAWCSPIHVGSGTVHCTHGVLPIPAPATKQLLHGWPTYATEVPGELATPTGAALLRYFCKGDAPMPCLNMERVGSGAGTKELFIPNLLRVSIGRVIVPV